MEELEHIPHFHYFAKKIRDGLEITNKSLREIAFENKKNYENFMALFNSDLVFRIKFTHEYYLLADLFDDPKEKAIFMRLLEELRVQKRDYRQRLQTVEPIIIKTKANSLSLESTAPRFDWTHPDSGLSNYEKWQHYESELQRITFDYNLQKIRVRNNSLLAESDCISRLIAQLSQDEPKNREMIAKLKAVQNDMETRKQQIMGIPTHKQDGSVDLKKVAEQEAQMERLQNDVFSRVDGLLSALGNENAVINEIRAEHEALKEEYAEEIRDIEQVFLVQKEELTLHLEKAKALHLVDEIIRNASSSQVDENQRDNHEKSIQTLENHKNRLTATNDPVQIQTILQECKDELAKVKSLLQDSVDVINPPDEEVLAKKVEQENPEARIPEVVVEQPRDEVKPEHEAVLDPKEERSHDEILLNHMVPDQPQKPIHFDEEVAVRREEQLRFRKELREGFSPELKLREDALRDISKKIENIINDEDSTPESQDLAEAIKVQLMNIKEYTDYQEVPDDLKISFASNLEELGETDGALAKLRDKYADLFKPSEEPSLQIRQ